jgi:hypothetical protein
MIPPCEPITREGAVGWLATTPPWHPYRIGVVGDTEAEARQRFTEAFAAWEELHARRLDADRRQVRCDD